MFILRLKVLVGFFWLKNNDQYSRICPHSVFIMGVGISFNKVDVNNINSQYILTLQGKSHIKRLRQRYKDSIKRHIVSFI